MYAFRADHLAWDNQLPFSLLKIDSSLIQEIPTTVFYPSTPPSCLPPPLSHISAPSPFPFTKEQASKRQQSNPTKQDTRQGESPPFKTGQGNPKGGKES